MSQNNFLIFSLPLRDEFRKLKEGPQISEEDLVKYRQKLDEEREAKLKGNYVGSSSSKRKKKKHRGHKRKDISRSRSRSRSRNRNEDEDSDDHSDKERGRAIKACIILT